MNAQLPSEISGEKIALLKDARALWPYIQKLSEGEHLYLASCYGYESTEKFIAVFSDENIYCNEYVPFMQDERAKMGSHVYWIYNHGQDRLTGNFFIETVPDHPDVLSVGFEILPTCRGRGLAAEAAKTASDYILKNNIAAYVCSETNLDNTSTFRTLIRAQFRNMGIGLTTIPALPVFGDGEKWQFMRTLLPHHHWPIARLANV